MTGSVALDVVIGLVFVYLLYSLLATVFCEIIATNLGLRARTLQQAIRRMLEDSPVTSEPKVIAFPKHVWFSIRNLFSQEEGPASCIFYHLPVIKYLGRNSYHSKPSYITEQNFSKAILEIFRKYGGGDDKNDHEKIQYVLNGSFPYEQPLLELKQIIDEHIRGAAAKKTPLVPEAYVGIRSELKTKLDSIRKEDIIDPAQRKLFEKVRSVLKYSRMLGIFPIRKKRSKADVYKVDQLLNLFGQETRLHLKSLLKDAGHDLDKFQGLLEQWFNDTMERAKGWYKEKTQWLLFVIGISMAVVFNASTLRIVNILSTDTKSRDQLVQMATTYMEKYQPAPFDTNRVEYNKRLDSLLQVKKEIEQDVYAANAVLGLGWDFPDSLALLKIEDLKKDPAFLKNKQQYLTVKVDSNQTERLIRIPAGMNRKTLSALLVYSQENFVCYLFPRFTATPINDYVVHVNRNNTSIALCKTKFFFLNFWGYFLTAIAISLGAPFWFDLLSKLMKVRGAVADKSSAETQPAPAKPVQPITVNVNTQPGEEAVG